MQKRDRLDIIYEDKSIIVINKDAHLLTVATEDEKFNTLYHKVHEYLYKKNKNNKVFIVHRLDKDTSGLVLFAKTEEAKKYLQDNWEDFTREYIAVVEGKMEKSSDTIKEYLTETKTLLTYATTPDKGKYAETSYEVLKNATNSVLKVNIKTGRKNQIRVAMQDIGHPIIGDKKYGAKTNPLRRVCLHANRLVIKHPVTKKEMEFIAKIPNTFKIFNI